MTKNRVRYSKESVCCKSVVMIHENDVFAGGLLQGNVYVRRDSLVFRQPKGPNPRIPFRQVGQEIPYGVLGRSIHDVPDPASISLVEHGMHRFLKDVLRWRVNGCDQVEHGSKRPTLPLLRLSLQLGLRRLDLTLVELVVCMECNRNSCRQYLAEELFDKTIQLVSRMSEEKIQVFL